MAPTVLVVEDDDGIAAPLVRTLEREGYDVNRVANGRSAVDAVTSAAEGSAHGSGGGAIGIVVLDLGLPDIDGLEVCRRIRDAGSTVPILILTARGRAGPGRGTRRRRR